MDSNPWQVDGIQAFSYLHCPECEFLAKEETLFQDHAEENHPLSFVLFSEESFEEEDTFKSIETGIILFIDQVAAVFFVKIGSLIWAHLKDVYQFTKPLRKLLFNQGPFLKTVKKNYVQNG